MRKMTIRNKKGLENKRKRSKKKCAFVQKSKIRYMIIFGQEFGQEIGFGFGSYVRKLIKM